ncbi:MAG: hypothetical protein WDZ85_03800 [Candidatus Paceibacterota bacterium]
MPLLNDFRCDKCDFELPSGWGGYTYVINQKGDRIHCPHPGERDKIKEILGYRRFFEYFINRRIGFHSDCVCLDCLSQFNLDIKKDKIECSFCRSNNIKTESDMVGQICPKCKVGTVREIYTGSMC